VEVHRLSTGDQKIEGRLDAALRQAGSSLGRLSTARNDQEVFQSAWDSEDVVVRRIAPEPVRQRSFVTTAPAIEPKPAPVPEPQIEERGIPTRLDERAAKAIESPVFVEQFRRASATLIEAQAAGNVKVLLVTSASPGDGKTLTALNLALVLGRSYGRRVLLIDGDLRRPSLHRVVGVSNRSGLADALQSRADVRLEVTPITDTVTLLPAGPADPDPLRSLSSARMKRVIQEAAQRFDWVIIDSAPVDVVADASVLATLTDGIVFVVRAEYSQYPAVKKAMQTLGHERILGVILNGVSPNSDYNSYYQRQPEME
jgi:capsular exopolysaccharide synthesis family protein